MSKASLSCTINGAHFEAEGNAEEVGTKFSEFLDGLFSPLNRALKDAGLKK